MRCLCVKGFPFVVVFAEMGFPKAADWLTVQWSFVVKSWALAEDAELVWLKFEVVTDSSLETRWFFFSLWLSSSWRVGRSTLEWHSKNAESDDKKHG